MKTKKTIKHSNIVIVVGDVADNFVSVNCSFEHNFICGYKTSKLGTWRWWRATGKDNNKLTGPESDAHGNPLG